MVQFADHQNIEGLHDFFFFSAKLTAACFQAVYFGVFEIITVIIMTLSRVDSSYGG